jgi:dephospho-CoA kinase
MKRLLIGLTGNIACGKSTVAKMLGELGAEVIDADRLVHELMAPGTETWRAILRRFGHEISRPDGTIDRSRLAGTVFRDPEALRNLEAILHPEVRRLAEARIAASERPVVVLEAIKLIESGWHERADSVWVVTCAREQQIRRLMETRGMERGDAETRVDAQAPPEDKVRHADVVIDNSGSIEEARTQVEAAWGTMIGYLHTSQ